MNAPLARLVCASLIFLSGCSLFTKKRDQAVVRPSTHEPNPSGLDGRPKMLAIANGNNGKDTPLQDPSSMIPPPPELQIPEIPGAPTKEPALASQTKPTTNAATDIMPAVGVRPLTEEAAIVAPPVNKPETPIVTTPPVSANKESPIQAIKRLHQLAAEKLARLDGFEAKLTRREYLNGKFNPENVMIISQRSQPLSVHMKWVGTEAKGREIVYVSGRKDDVVEILTAKGDGAIIIPAGKRFTFSPNDATVKNQSRYDIRSGGMVLTVSRLGQNLIRADQDPVHAARFKYLGRVTRPERPSSFEASEETLVPNADPLFPKGGKRTIYFDADPASASYGLPIMLISLNEEGREVEYYYFDQLKPHRFTDDDFDVNKLWKK